MHRLALAPDSWLETRPLRLIVQTNGAALGLLISHTLASQLSFRDIGPKLIRNRVDCFGDEKRS